MIGVEIRHAWPGFSLDVAFDAPRGVTALFGRSGAGKTTIVNAVAGLLRPDHGRIVVDGVALTDTGAGVFLPPHKRRVGYVFQDARLFPHLSVMQNLLYGRRFARDSLGPTLAEVTDLLGIGALLHRRPAALSGGEKSRVAIGRALLSNPRLLLLDEPLAALDEARRAEILPYLERLRDTSAIPILYVSHSAAEVARLATTVVLLDAGRVVRTGPAAETLADPAGVAALGPAGLGALVQGRIAAHDADGLTRIDTSAGALFVPGVVGQVGDAVRLRVLAQDVILSRTRPEGLSALNILPAVVTELRPGQGPGALVQCQMGDDLIIARITQRSVAALALQPGVACWVIVKSAAIARQDVGAQQDVGRGA